MTKIQSIRERKKWSPAQLAVAANVSERTILNHERGAGFLATPRVQGRIADALGVKRERIFKEGQAR